nr:MAG TPA: hypothetical protein [Caudoviricetes sp.]
MDLDFFYCHLTEAFAPISISAVIPFNEADKENTLLVIISTLAVRFYPFSPKRSVPACRTSAHSTLPSNLDRALTIAESAYC